MTFKIANQNRHQSFCNLDNYTINTDYLAGIISSAKDIKAIVGVDLFGHTCDWDTIKKIAGNIPVVQD